MKKIYIVDLIGKHCGMHYYHSSFVETLKNEKFDIKILSNYKLANNNAFFPLIFKSKKLFSTLLLLYSFIKLLSFVLLKRKARYIYLSYGEPWDLPFLFIATIFSNKFIIDIHEVHALRYKDESSITKIYKCIYKSYIKVVIYHSERTFQILNQIQYKNKLLYVPHFKYNFQKEYINSNLSDEIASTFLSNRTKFLFFGNISIVKGGQILADALLKLDNQIREMEIVIAGKNVDNINFSKLKKYSPYLTVIERHINDDELIYLYKHTDFVLLPYQKSSQSGIFAMATFFNKPMILSEIPYFNKMLKDFPSFGISVPLDKYDEGIKKVLTSKIKFYTQKDMDNFEMKSEFNNFIKDFNDIIY